MLTSTHLTPSPSRQTGFKAGYIFKKDSPALLKKTVLKALEAAPRTGEYKNHYWFCFFPYISTKQTAAQRAVETELKANKIRIKPARVEVKPAEWEQLTIKVEEKIDQITAPLGEKLVKAGETVRDAVKTVVKKEETAAKKTIKKKNQPLKRRYKSPYPYTVKSSFEYFNCK